MNIVDGQTGCVLEYDSCQHRSERRTGKQTHPNKVYVLGYGHEKLLYCSHESCVSKRLTLKT